MDSKLNLALVIALSRLNQKINKETRYSIRGEGLTLGQFGVLEALYHKGDLSVNEIIESVLSTSGNITVVINNLEKNLLVEKEINPNDRRSMMIKITDKGRDLIRNLFPKHQKNIDNALSGYSYEEKKMLLKLLKEGIEK